MESRLQPVPRARVREGSKSPPGLGMLFQPPEGETRTKAHRGVDTVKGFEPRSMESRLQPVPRAQVRNTVLASERRPARRAGETFQLKNVSALPRDGTDDATGSLIFSGASTPVMAGRLTSDSAADRTARGREHSGRLQSEGIPYIVCAVHPAQVSSPLSPS